MCCLFGLIDYGNNFKSRQKAHILSVLARECEARGIDATGIAYRSGKRLHVYKRPLPAHKLNFILPADVRSIMGHTRMATQGSEKKNYNNHPFLGMAGGISLALAHNGMLRNDLTLRRELRLPRTKVETDSYVAVQLIERERMVNFESLRRMAEQVEGSFTFTVLDQWDNFYFVKGDNPLCLVHFPKTGVYLYASTEEILDRAMKKLRLPLDNPIQVEVCCGDILRINPQGQIAGERFDTTSIMQNWYYSTYLWPTAPKAKPKDANAEYEDELRSIAGAFGYAPQMIDKLVAQGFTTDEIEEALYSGEI